MVSAILKEGSADPSGTEKTHSLWCFKESVTLQISIVTYYINADVIELLDSLVISSSNVTGLNYSVILIENGYKEQTDIHKLIEAKYSFCQVIITGENLGYGRAHNLALSDQADYHLILNPDVIFSKETIGLALQFMQEHPECGLLSPQAFWQNGDRQYLCKRYPNLITLFLRAFAPAGIQKLFRKKMEHYCMKTETQRNEVFWQPFSVSGCFMLFRNDVLLKLNGFDKDYFLYFEDTDLSFRAGKITDVAYVPKVKIIHHGGNVSRKGFKHIFLFTHSMIKFFNKHGWRIC